MSKHTMTDPIEQAIKELERSTAEAMALFHKKADAIMAARTDDELRAALPPFLAKRV